MLLLAIWLSLNRTLHPAHWVLGVLLAWWLPWQLATRIPALRRPAHWSLAARLLGRFAADMLRANLSVARRVLSPRLRLNSAFVAVPLRARDPFTLTLLTSMITLTPGTLSAQLTDDHTQLLVHALDLSDAAALIAEIQTRYEAPLIILFEEPRC
jgi:multicomponent K+:H+ antiporter subunit E